MRHAGTLGVGVGATPLVTFSAMQMLGSASTPQWPALTDEFLSAHFWVTVLVMVIGGAFGGVAYELLLRKGTIELPHRVTPKASGHIHTHAPAETLIALGIVGRAIVGSAAAISVLMVANPQNAHAALALSVTSGAAAPALIRLMKKQLVAAVGLLDHFSHNSQQPRPAPKPSASQPTTPASAPAVQPA